MVETRSQQGRTLQIVNHEPLSSTPGAEYGYSADIEVGSSGDREEDFIKVSFVQHYQKHTPGGIPRTDIGARGRILAIDVRHTPMLKTAEECEVAALVMARALIAAEIEYTQASIEQNF